MGSILQLYVMLVYVYITLLNPMKMEIQSFEFSQNKRGLFHMDNSSYNKRRDLTAGIAAIATAGTAGLVGVRTVQKAFSSISGATPDIHGDVTSFKGCSPLRVAAAYAVVTPALAIGIGAVDALADHVFTKVRNRIDRCSHEASASNKGE